MVDKRTEFKNNIERVLAERGWSKSDLAQAIGKSRQEVSTWCSGRVYPTPKTIHLIAEGLGVEPSELTEGSFRSCYDFRYLFEEIQRISQATKRIEKKIKTLKCHELSNRA